MKTRISLTLFKDELEANKGIDIRELALRRVYEEISKGCDLELHIINIEQENISMDSCTGDIEICFWCDIIINENKVKEIKEIEDRLEVGL